MKNLKAHGRLMLIFLIPIIFIIALGAMCHAKMPIKKELQIDKQKPLPSFEKNRKAYKNTSDSVKQNVVIDQELFSEFFNSNETSYKWYIIKSDDGTFENILGGELSKEDKLPVEHTSNCISTHQGKHGMNFCDANLKSGVLQLEIHGGLPAYSSSLLIEIKENLEFFCFFKAAYPAPVTNLKWTIVSKKLKLKAHDFDKGQRLYAWLSVEFEEKATYQGETNNGRYKIEGFIKPVVN